MSGEHNSGPGLLRERRENIAAGAFHGHFVSVVSQPGQFAVKKVSDGSLIACDRLNVHQLARKSDDVHDERIPQARRAVPRESNSLRGNADSSTRFRRYRGCKRLGRQFLVVRSVESRRTAEDAWTTRGGEGSDNVEWTRVPTQNSIRSLFLDGPVGRLEALLNAGIEGATHSALVCHPHPLYGGTFHNKVVFHTMKALHSFGFPVLRFNFRGTGLSQGQHDNGYGEVEDVRAALDWLDREFRLPIVFAGFSFGAAVGLPAACPDPRVRAVIGLGIPVVPADERAYDFDFLQDCSKLKLFVSGARDQFGPRAKLEEVVASAAEPKNLVLIEGADHFFEGRLRELRAAVESWVKSWIVT